MTLKDMVTLINNREPIFHHNVLIISGGGSGSSWGQVPTSQPSIATSAAA